MRRIVTITSVTTLALALSAALGGPARAGDSTVCSSGGDFTSIQAAIDDAGTVAGDTITLCTETFTQGDIMVDKQLTIAGSGTGSTFVVPPAIGFRPQANGIVIRDMTIRDGLQAIRFEDAGGTIDNTEINNVHMVDNSSNAIEPQLLLNS